MKRIISGVKPTGELTLGNYLGTMQSWPKLQAKGEVYYFIANLHALNIRQAPKELRQRSLETLAWMLAIGIDTDKSKIFLESDIPAITGLFTILNNYVTMGELSRMTQFKDKSQKLGPEGQVVGLFEYPVLMAADILMFDVDLVPVGDDQKQHVEITRDIAERFNSLYGPTFVVPQPLIQAEGARIMDLQQPLRKMSKSDAETAGYILLADPPDTIAAKIKRAVTDSGHEVRISSDKPAVSNLINIFALINQTSVQSVEQQFVGKSYGQLKDQLSEAVVSHLLPIQQRFTSLMGNVDQLNHQLQATADQVAPVADNKLRQVQIKLGLGSV